MRYKASQGLILLLIFFLLFIDLRENSLIAKGINVLHLKKKDFESFFEENQDWKEKFFKECRFDRLKYDFFCWDQETRKILSPDVRAWLCHDKKLPEALNNKLLDYYKNIKLRKTYLITNDQMVQISLQCFAENDYHFVHEMKSSCKDKEENIEFYIFDIIQENQMDIYYYLRDSSGKSQFVASDNVLKESPYVTKWEEVSKNIIEGKNPGIKITIRLSALIGERAVVDIYPDNKFVHFRNNENDSAERHNKLVTTYAGNGYLINDLVFDLSDEKDINMLKTNGIYIGPIKNEKRITYSSLYSLIKESFDNGNIKINDKTFELFYARTENFESDTSDICEKPNERIKNIELPRILSFIGEIVRRRQKVTRIQLVGYADGYTDQEWNRIVSIKRAANVKKWLKKGLETLGFKDQQDFKFDDLKRCSEKYYDKGDRCVDIKVF